MRTTLTLGLLFMLAGCAAPGGPAGSLDDPSDGPAAVVAPEPSTTSSVHTLHVTCTTQVGPTHGGCLQNGVAGNQHNVTDWIEGALGVRVTLLQTEGTPASAFIDAGPGKNIWVPDAASEISYEIVAVEGPVEITLRAPDTLPAGITARATMSVTMEWYSEALPVGFGADSAAEAVSPGGSEEE